MFFFFQAEDGIRDVAVTGVQTCALPIYRIAAAGLSAQVQAAACAVQDLPAGTGFDAATLIGVLHRSEERRVGKEGRSRGSPDHLKKKKESKWDSECECNEEVTRRVSG